MRASQTILLTGASGYLGSHLARAFVQAGHRVLLLKRQSSKLDRLGPVLGDLEAFDIEDGIEQPFKTSDPIDAVVHCATSYGRAGESSIAVFEANTALPLRLLETAVSF